MSVEETSDWSDFERILCVRPDNLGDVLMTTPALRALKRSGRKPHLTLLTSRVGSLVAEHVPEIDDSLEFDPPWYRHDRHAGPREVDAVVRQLRDGQYDGAILFTVFSQNPLPSAMLCYLAGIPRIAAYCRENPYGLVSDWLPDNEPFDFTRHEVQRQLDLVAWLGAAPNELQLSLDVPHDRQPLLRSQLTAKGIDIAAPWLLLHPGASEARRRYPTEGFAAAARQLAQEHGWQVLLTGTAAEAPLAESIARQAGSGVHAVTGMFDLGELIALIDMAPLLISNNTGPVHIAAAVQTPVVVLYAQTNPQHTPWCVPHRVLQFPVAPEARSQNVLVRHAGERFFNAGTPLPGLDEIVSAALDLLNDTLRADVAAVPPRTDASRPIGTSTPG